MALTNEPIDAVASVESPEASTPAHGAAFDAFFRNRYGAVVKAVMYAGASREDAEDATADAMIAAFLRWEMLENPTAWVRTAALHDFVNHTQRERRRPLLEAKAARMRLADRPELEPQGEPDEHAHVTAMIRRLPLAQRKVMAFAIDGFAPSEIADLLQIPADTVRSNLRHARERLRRELDHFSNAHAGDEGRES
jgi:RNA polymerase sigma factor (sigma-70 family)